MEQERKKRIKRCFTAPYLVELDEELNSKIQEIMTKTKDEKMLNKCAFLLNIQVTSEKLLIKKRWMFNKGNIRDIPEWENYIPRKYTLYYTPPYYIPFFVAIVAFFIIALNDTTIAFFSLAVILFVTLWVSALIYYIGSSKYLNFLTKQKDVSQKELLFAVNQLKEAKVFIRTVLITSVSVAHSVKKCTKRARQSK